MAVSVLPDLGTLGRVGTALADPTRRRVLVHLTAGPGYPAEMADQFGAVLEGRRAWAGKTCGCATCFAVKRRSDPLPRRP